MRNINDVNWIGLIRASKVTCRRYINEVDYRNLKIKMHKVKANNLLDDAIANGAFKRAPQKPVGGFGIQAKKAGVTKTSQAPKPAGL